MDYEKIEKILLENLSKLENDKLLLIQIYIE